VQYAVCSTMQQYAECECAVWTCPTQCIALFIGAAVQWWCIGIRRCAEGYADTPPAPPPPHPRRAELAAAIPRRQRQAGASGITGVTRDARDGTVRWQARLPSGQGLGRFDTAEEAGRAVQQALAQHGWASAPCWQACALLHIYTVR
jgi:hypothetical protein